MLAQLVEHSLRTQEVVGSIPGREEKMDIQINPWSGKELEEFLYFCCPECNIKDQSKELFLKHALDTHPNARECLFDVNIKTENFNDEDYDIANEDSDTLYYDSEMVKCDIKEESTEQIENPNKNSDENKLLTKLVEEYGLNELGQFDSRRSGIWREITEKFNNDTGHNRTVQQIRNRWKNYRVSFVGKKTKHENEILVTLVKKFGLNKLAKFSPQRNVVWVQITEEFNSITGYNWYHKKLSERWKNYRRLLKNSNKEPFVENIESVKCEIKQEDTEQQNKFKDSLNFEMSNEFGEPKKVSEFQEGEKIHKCELCGKGYSHMCFLELHAKKVHGIVNILGCEFCNKEFDRKSKLDAHIKNIHEKTYNVVCDTCGKSFGHPRALNKHHRSVHEGIKDHVCNVCSKACSDLSDLKKHIKCVHEGIKEHVCDTCGQAFGMRKSLKIHIKNIHEGIKDHICKLCGKAFVNFSKLNEHTRTVHEGKRRHKCKICDKGFITPSKLKIHMKNVHPGVNLESS